jgi:glycosyltransferase-like protein
MTPPRLALLTYSTHPRGSVVHTLELAIALHRRGRLQVDILPLDKTGTGFGRALPVPVRSLAAQPWTGSRDRLDHLVQQRITEAIAGVRAVLAADRAAGIAPYDLYHAQDCLVANALADLRDRGEIPGFVRTVHHLEDFASPYLHDCQDRSILRADRCLCVSDRWQRALAQRYGVLAARVTNGVDLARFASQPTGQEAALAQRLGATRSPRFLTIGGIEPRKNSLTLLRAFAHLRDRHPTAQLILAGGATLFDYQAYREDFLALAVELGLAIDHDLLLPGVVTEADLPVLYRLADAFVFPSVTEGWGLVVLEAIASGLPVITSNQAPFTEFLSPEQALLIDPHDPRAIAQAMHQSLDPVVRQGLVMAAMSVGDRYTWDSSARAHEQIYDDVLLALG